MRLIIYLLLFMVGYFIVKSFIRMQKSYREAFKKNDKKDSRYKNIEEADFREINDKDKKNDQE